VNGLSSIGNQRSPAVTCDHRETFTVWRYVVCDPVVGQWPHRRPGAMIEVLQVVCESCATVLEERPA